MREYFYFLQQAAGRYYSMSLISLLPKYWYAKMNKSINFGIYLVEGQKSSLPS